MENNYKPQQDRGHGLRALRANHVAFGTAACRRLSRQPSQHATLIDEQPPHRSGESVLAVSLLA
ncbi:MAG: hypothetical protein K6D59_11185 [Bacteroidales bacterium]|nr:hypothetical protein [Bacteroidales bacterium]